MSSTAPIPVPEQMDDNSASDRRLWIGNLDLRITEYVLLKLIQKFGKPERFDFMYHVSGPEKGKPKGYCFVTFPSREVAEKAQQSLHGKMALSRRLVVHWARDKYHNDPVPSCSSGLTTKGQETKTDGGPESTESKIRAIEAKLSAMQETQKDFGLSELPSAPPGSNLYSSANATHKNKASSSSNRGSYHRRRPYVPSGHGHGHGHRGRRR